MDSQQQPADAAGNNGNHPRELFRKFAAKTSTLAGSHWAFITAVLLIVAWAASGPLFGFSDTWQMIINTTTTIVTFLMVFLLQSTQNRDARAIHLKLDELIKKNKHARNRLVDLEEVADEEIEQLEEEFREFRARNAHAEARGDTLPITDPDGPQSTQPSAPSPDRAPRTAAR
jgi:low affinity Fe/Cu permease